MFCVCWDVHDALMVIDLWRWQTAWELSQLWTNGLVIIGLTNTWLVIVVAGHNEHAYLGFHILAYWSRQYVCCQLAGCHPASTTHRPEVGPMLVRRLRRRPNIGPTLGRCVTFSGTVSAYQPRQSVWLSSNSPAQSLLPPCHLNYSITNYRTYKHHKLICIVLTWSGDAIVPLDVKGCICHFTKWQIHPFISKGVVYSPVIWQGKQTLHVYTYWYHKDHNYTQRAAQ